MPVPSGSEYTSRIRHIRSSWYSKAEMRPRMLTTALVLLVLCQARAQSLGNQDATDNLVQVQGSIPIPIDTIKGCQGLGGPGSSTSLPTNLQTCRFQVRLAEDETGWFNFTIHPASVRNMSVMINMRAFAGRGEMVLFEPGAVAFLQARTLYSLEGSQESFIPLRPGDMLAGEYRLRIRATVHNPLIGITISTTAVAVQLAPQDRNALRRFGEECCSLTATRSSWSFCNELLPSLLGSVNATVDLCHRAPNTCDDQGRLTRLVLPNRGLQCGRFPRSLAGFKELVTLDLSANILNDTLAGVGEVVRLLPKLRRVFLLAAGLKGKMDCALIQQHAPNLTTLALSSNYLDGGLPPCYTITDNLEELYVSRNYLTGTLPEFSERSRLSILFATGQRTGDGISGTIPKSLTKAAMLKFLNLANNSLSGPLPDLPSAMIDLDLGENRLEGQLWSKVPASLLHVDLHDNLLSGTLPADMATSWPSVTFVGLGGNRLTGDLPALPPSLLFLSAPDNQLGPNIRGAPGGRASTAGRRLQQAPGTLVQLPDSLLRLDISNNSFAFDVRMANWSSLRLLSAEYNQLTGQVPVSFLRSMRFLYLDNNRLTGRLDELTWRSRNLVELSLSSNQLEGGLPASLAKLENLLVLNVANNKLSGELNAFADAIPMNNSFMIINLSENQFTGQVPPTLANMAMWRTTGRPPLPLQTRTMWSPFTTAIMLTRQSFPRVLDISHNRLTGPYPSFIVQRAPQVMTVCRCTLLVLTGGGANRLTCPTSEVVKQAGWNTTGALALNDSCQEPNTAKRVLLAYLLDANKDYVFLNNGTLPRSAAGVAGAAGVPRSTLESPAKQGGPHVGLIIGAVVGAVGGVLVLAGLGYLGYKRVYLTHRAKRFQRFEDNDPGRASHLAPAGEHAVVMATLPGVMTGRETV